jgi:hypothetical protein
VERIQLVSLFAWSFKNEQPCGSAAKAASAAHFVAGTLIGRHIRFSGGNDFQFKESALFNQVVKLPTGGGATAGNIAPVRIRMLLFTLFHPKKHQKTP